MDRQQNIRDPNNRGNGGGEGGDNPPANNEGLANPPANTGGVGAARNPQETPLRDLLSAHLYAEARTFMANNTVAVNLEDTTQAICLLHHVSDIVDIPMDIVQTIIDQGGAAPVLSRRNAGFVESPLMHMVRTGTGNRRKTQIIDLVLRVSPHYVYSIDAAGRSVLDVFANQWSYCVDGRDDDWDEGGDLRRQFEEAMRDRRVEDARLQALMERYAVLLKASTEVLSLPLTEQPPVPLYVHGMAASRPLRSSAILHSASVFPSRPVGGMPVPHPDCMLLNAATSKCFVPLSAFQLIVRLAHPNDGANRNACGQVALVALLVNSTHWQQPQQLPPFVETLVSRFRGTAAIRDNDGRMALHMAIDLGFRWNDPTTQAIVNDYPHARFERDRRTRLFPFMMAAMGLDGDENTAFWLLREGPAVITQLVGGGAPAAPTEGDAGRQPQQSENQGA